MRWPVFFFLSLGISVVGGYARAPGDLLEWGEAILFLFALRTAWNAPRGYEVPVFWWCGFLRDLFLSSRLGGGIFLYAGIGIVVALLRSRVREDHPIPRFTLPFFLLLLLFSFSIGMGSGGWGLLGVRGLVQMALQAAFACLLLHPLLGLVLRWEILQPWEGES